MSDNLFCLTGTPHAVGAILLVLYPPVTKQLDAEPYEQHRQHTDTDMQQPMVAAFRGRLVMDDNPAVALLDDPLPVRCGIPPATGRQTLRVKRVVLLNIGVFYSPVGAGGNIAHMPFPFINSIASGG